MSSLVLSHKSQGKFDGSESDLPNINPTTGHQFKYSDGRNELGKENKVSVCVEIAGYMNRRKSLHMSSLYEVCNASECRCTL